MFLNIVDIFCSGGTSNRLLFRSLFLFECPSKEGSVFIRLIADTMVGLQELYISLMLVSSTCSVDISWVGGLKTVGVDMFCPFVY